jgi:hypothetical protein
MAVIYASALRTTRMDAVLAAIGNAGKIKVYTSADTLLATWTLPTPSGSVSGDILTFDCDPDIADSSADATGTASKATITTAADAVIVSGLTVGTGSENIVLNTASIVATATVTLQTGTITHNTAG